jgi:hypothetical protein
VSRSRQLSPLPDDLPPAVRTLLGELRLLKDRSGYDLRALAIKTHASRSSWGRWLSGETWIPREAVASMAELCAGDPGQLNALWQRAEGERRARQFTDPPRPADPAGPPIPLDPTGPPHPNGDASRGPASASHPADTAAAPGESPPEPPVLTGGLRRARSRQGRTIFVGTLLGCAIAAGAAGLVIGLSLRTAPAQPVQPSAQWLTRQEILARVRLWHPQTDQRIPYSQSLFYKGYRTDGSGYASMAIGLPAPGPNSPDLASGQYTRQITPAELLPGDLVINATGDAGTRQVAVFDRWADAAHTRYWVYQQRRGYGTDHLVLSYALDTRSPYHAYRPLNVHEIGTPTPPEVTP